MPWLVCRKSRVPPHGIHVLQSYGAFHPTTLMNTTDTHSETYKALLRSELSVIEAYTRAIEKSAGQPGARPLERIRADHRASAEVLRKIISENRESPSLVTLQPNAVHGIAEYENAFEEDKLDEAVEKSIRWELLPALRAHLVELEYCKSTA